MTPSNSSANPLDDYEDLIAAFNARGVEYVIVGAYALGVHGYVRGTSDIDIFVNPTVGNAEKVSAALKDFLGVVVAVADLAQEKRLVTLGSKTNGVDIMTSVSGLTWERAWNERLTAKFGGQTAFFLSRASLIDAKRAAGRAKDRADLQGLGADDSP